VGALTEFTSTAKRNRTNRFRGFAFRPEHVLRNKENDRVLGVHRCPKQTGRVFGSAWNDNSEPRVMSEHRFVRLAVPKTSTGQIGSVRRINHSRTFPIAKGSPPQSRDVRDQLIEARINKIDELQLEDRALAVGSQPTGHAENRRFGERRIENLLREIGREFMGQTENAALGILDIFAKNDALLIFFESGAQSFVYRIADSVFSRRQNFPVDF